MNLAGITVTPLGLKVEEGATVTPEAFSELFAKVLGFSKAANWLLGDTLALADRTWGNRFSGSKYEEAAVALGVCVGTVKGIVRTCQRFPMEQRSAELSFTHHLEVCNTRLSEDEQEQAIKEAEEKNMSCSAFRKRLREVKAASITTEEKRELNCA